MASHIVTLKDNNNDISYPITPVDAVFVDSNTTLADALDDKVETDLSNLGNNSIPSNKIDWSTINGEQFVGRFTTGSSFTLPSNYFIYHIRGRINYNSPSSSAGMLMKMTNYSGTNWCRRMQGSLNGVEWVESNYTDGHFVILGSTSALGTSNGLVTIDMTVVKKSGAVVASCNFTHAGAQSSGMAWGEHYLADSSQDVTLSFVSTGRTFSNMDIVVTGVLQ